MKKSVFDNLNKNLIDTIKELYTKFMNNQSVNSRLVVDTFNEVYKNMKPHQAYTSCGTCLRKMICQMNIIVLEFERQQMEAIEDALDAQETASQDTNTPQEVQHTTEPIKKAQNVNKKAVGRPKKQKSSK